MKASIADKIKAILHVEDVCRMARENVYMETLIDMVLRKKQEIACRKRGKKNNKRADKWWKGQRVAGNADTL